jgi:hypothetical protein
MATKPVDVLVAEAVERAARELHLTPATAREVLEVAGFSALVEALSGLRAAALPYQRDHDPALTTALALARAALGGERVSSTADLTKIVTDVLDDPETKAAAREYGDHIRSCQASAQANEGQQIVGGRVSGRAELEAELGELRAVGDRLQSEASRLATVSRSKRLCLSPMKNPCAPSARLPYEAALAAIEIESAISDWTAARAAVDGETTTTKGSDGA